MRVLFILHEVSPHNGSWKSAYTILSGLKKQQDIELQIICPSKKGVYSILKKEGFNVSSIKYIWNNHKLKPKIREKFEYFPRMLRRKFYNYLWMKKMMSLCRSFNPDIIHSNSSVITNGFELSQKLNLPHVWHVREYGDLDFGLSLASQNQFFKFNKYFICVTKGVKNHRGLSSNHQARVIYNGIDSESAIVNPCVTIDDKYFLYVGSLNEGKGIRDLLTAWKNVKGNIILKDFSLKVCGGTEKELSYWKTYCSIENIVDVKWMGRRDDIQYQMHHARAVIVPSHFEAFGRVMPEAIVNGALVIGRNTAGTKEQFDNGLKITGSEIGLRFNNINELENHIIQVANNNPIKYITLIKNGQETFRKLYTNEINVLKVKQFYDYILKKSNI